MTDLMIIGKKGQLGAELVSYCKKNGKKFVAFGSDQLDITDYAKVTQIVNKINPKVIINTAAFRVVTECEKNPSVTFMVNSFAVGNLAEVAKKNNSKLVTYSTDYVFDGKKEKPYLENDIPNPLQIYGMSKFASEQLIQKVYPEGTYVIRTCGLYGGKVTKGQGKKGNFVLNILAEAKKEEAIRASNELIVNPTSAKNLAEATMKSLDLGAPFGIYHLVNEGYLSWYDFAKMILKLAGIKKSVTPIKGQATVIDLKRPKFSALKNKKAKNMGIVLPKIEDGLREYLREII